MTINTQIVRLGIVAIGICILYVALIFRLFYWQIIRSSELRELGRRQSSQTIEIQALRGQILASDDFPLATNTVSYLLYANPKIVKADQDIDKLAETLAVPPASISAVLKPDLFWVKIAGGLDNKLKSEIEKLNLPGFGFEEEYKRFYPEASMAAHLVGFVGRDKQGAPTGYFGIEGQYESQLSGRPGAQYLIRDALGNDILNDIREDAKIDGRSVKLTLDRTIEFLAEKRLEDGIRRYNADGGTVIVMESATGKILAMANSPKFDPQKYYEYESATYVNPAISFLYEPGSTFKVLVMAAALDSKVIKDTTICNICSGPVQIGEYKIRTWNDKYNPNATMRDVIIHSDNIGMVFVSRKLGLDNMLNYLEKFGLFKKTGIDLQGEVSGVARDRNSWYPIDTATVAFGQGISVTPIQLLTAVNAIANNGILMKPYVVSDIVTDEGRKISVKPAGLGRVISFSSSKILASMMVDAVEQGEAKWTAIKNYRIAGKTGTAQIPVAGHYDPDQTMASFVGFFPSDKPKVTMLVLVNRPKTSIYGSETAAPIFFNIARDLIKYYSLPSN